LDLLKLDKRIIYGLLLVAVAVPLFLKVKLPVSISEQTARVYDAVENVHAGDFVIVSFDFEASSLPEIRPVAEAMLRHLFNRGARIVGIALFSEGTAIGYDLLNQMAAESGKKYGEDFVYLGFRPQYISAILGIGEEIESVFPLDYMNNPWHNSGPFGSVSSYDDVELVVSIADGSLPTYWVEYAGVRYGQKIAVALTAVMVTSYYPYTEAGQIEGMVAGLRGAAEYEDLLGFSGGGQRGMLAQSFGHLMIVGLVVAVNLIAWRRKKR